MIPTREAPDSVRCADVVNEEIRDLLLRTGGWLGTEDRAEYERLVAEWSEAVREGVVEAA